MNLWDGDGEGEILNYQLSLDIDIQETIVNHYIPLL